MVGVQACPPGMHTATRPLPHHETATPRSDRPSPKLSTVLIGTVAALSVPLIVALVVQRQPRWNPVLDFAMFELRLRDVGGPDTPLVGPVARLYGHGQQGNHPGPISFYMMWPAYRSLGATPWAMQVASAGMHVLALGVATWIAFRRGGAALALVIVALALVVRGIGVGALTTPWNPYLSVVWWLVFLLATWAVIDEDLALLPVTVFAGSVCLQNHVEYAALTIGLGILAVGTVTVRARRDAAVRHDLLRWSAVAVAVGVLAWLPAVLDELTRSPGNLSVIWDHFRHPAEDGIGLGHGVETTLVMLSPWRLVAGSAVGTHETAGSLLPGSLLVVAWSAAALASSRAGHRPLVRLHVVLGAALALGVVTMSRITGSVWFWLGLWLTVTAALMIGATAWTVWCLASRRLDAAALVRLGRVATAAVVVVAAGLTVTTAIDATDTEPNNPRLSARLGELVDSTVAALGAASGPDAGRRGPYLVTWTDPVSLGIHGFGLLNELERRGFDVGTDEASGAAVTDHRVLAAREATAVIHLSVGSDIDAWRGKPGIEQAAYLDERSPRERDEYDRLWAEVIDGLRTSGLSELVPQGADPLLVPALDERVPKDIRDKLSRLMDIGLPTAVFVGPPDAFASAAGPNQVPG